MAAPCRLGCPALLLVLVPLGAGCQRELPYGEVEGVVTLNGKPLTDIEVVFLPDPEKGSRGRRSTSLTDKEGHYRITSDAGRAGAPVGLHRVCIIDQLNPPWTPVPALPGEDGKVPAGMKGPAGTKAGPAGREDPKRPRFPAAYGSANSTPLRDVEVKEGTQKIDFDLKRDLH
jgi:hypothetical protein